MNRLVATASVALPALLALACGGGAPSTPTALPPTPTATAPSQAPATPLPLAMGVLPAGTYRTSLFDPEIVMTLPAGWSLFFAEEPDSVFMGSADAEMLITRPAQVIDPETDDPITTPEDLLAWLVRHPELNATDPEPVEVGGIAAGYVDLSTTRDVDVLYGGGSGNFHLPPGDGRRFYVIPMDGPDLLVAVLRSMTGTFVEALAAGTPIVESMTFAP